MTTVFLSGSRRLGRIDDSVRRRLDNMAANGLAVIVGVAEWRNLEALLEKGDPETRAVVGGKVRASCSDQAQASRATASLF